MTPAGGALLGSLGRMTRAGRVTIVFPDGSTRTLGGPEPGPEATIRVHRARFLRRLVLGGTNGLADAYVDGDFDSPDLTALLLFGAANQSAWGALLEGRWPLRLAARLAHRLRPNSRRGSRRNIAAHYDLGNDFYRLWLDRGLAYSSAVFARSDQELEAAQDNKYRLICERAGIGEDDRVLEIGCGWGGFASYAARVRKARVRAVTISPAQFAAASQRIQQEGLTERVAIEKRDYRDLAGRYDALASIEMIEAVGERYWPAFFAKLRSLTAPGGRIALQSITIEEASYERYRRSADFIQRRIFPGGMLPSPEVIRRQARMSGLEPTDEAGYGEDYARTLVHWHRRFQEAWQDIAALGFDGRFRRLWTYYLSYCEAGFRAGRIDLRQFGFSAPR